MSARLDCEYPTSSSLSSAMAGPQPRVHSDGSGTDTPRYSRYAGKIRSARCFISHRCNDGTRARLDLLRQQPHAIIGGIAARSRQYLQPQWWSSRRAARSTRESRRSDRQCRGGGDPEHCRVHRRAAARRGIQVPDRHCASKSRKPLKIKARCPPCCRSRSAMNGSTRRMQRRPRSSRCAT